MTTIHHISAAGRQHRVTIERVLPTAIALVAIIIALTAWDVLISWALTAGR